MDILLGSSDAEWNGNNRSSWSRFLIGLLYRNQERIAGLKRYIDDIALERYEGGRAEYEAQAKEADPPFLDYLVRKIAFDAIDWTQEVLANKKIGLHLHHMRRSVKAIDGCGMQLFTSDRPVLMTNGLEHFWIDETRDSVFSG